MSFLRKYPGYSVRNDDGLRYLVLGYGEVVFSESAHYGMSLLIQHRDIQKEQS